MRGQYTVDSTIFRPENRDPYADAEASRHGSLLQRALSLSSDDTLTSQVRGRRFLGLRSQKRIEKSRSRDAIFERSVTGAI